jgi:hypothetical protein
MFSLRRYSVLGTSVDNLNREMRSYLILFALILMNLGAFGHNSGYDFILYLLYFSDFTMPSADTDI